MVRMFSRRRAISIFAAVAGLPLLRGAEAAAHPTTWEGQALGAPARLLLNHPDPVAASRLIELVVVEVARLEKVFSLSRADSALSELNKVGVLVAPPQDLVSLLHSSRGIWETTGGVFDPTVQPIWRLYYDHFSNHDASPAGPDKAEIARVLAAVGFDRLKFNRDRVVLGSAVGLTFNGIAQGYITDRIVDLLRNAGVTSCLVDMGEDRAIGSRSDGTAWQVGLAESENDEHPDHVLSIVDKAVATSSSSGFVFDEAGRFGHIIDPRNGITPRLYRRVSVVADDATRADAFATSFCLMPEGEIRAILEKGPDLMVDLISNEGVHARFGNSA
ncbi:FAD:protein FMN transferase [Rhizobium sp. 18055]|uniref:FAD:protein FMN transferase n=1 Tax=Rhizobium sp. 18055 TaxID=2681403 RepID=UPI00135716AF|nr:FAD:protein FMN transferase [Rhizobium sp. 18055]